MASLDKILRPELSWTAVVYHKELSHVTREGAFIVYLVIAANNLNDIYSLKGLFVFIRYLSGRLRDALARSVEASFTSNSTTPATNHGGVEWQALTIFSRCA